jgi:hypothetical protein
MASGTPRDAIARAVYDTVFAEGCRVLAAYLRASKLSRIPEQHAELVLAATTGGTVIRHLYGVDESLADVPDEKSIAPWVDLKSIREAVKLIASKWKI